LLISQDNHGRGEDLQYFTEEKQLKAGQLKNLAEDV
jgi:hypothetical protein